MSAKCGKCGKDLSGNEIVAKCVECSVTFHPACTRDGAVNFTKAKKTNWKCDSCKSDSSSVKSCEDSSLDEIKNFIIEAITSAKLEINANTNMQVKELKQSVSKLTEDVSKLTNKCVSLEESCNKLCGRCDTLEHDWGLMRDKVREMEQQLIDAEQHSRCANIEILGLPLTANEDIYDCLERIAKVINVPYKRLDVSVAHRLRLYSKKHSHPPVVVQFVSRSVREAWLSAARRKKGFSSTDLISSLTPSKIFINEQLTPHNKALLGCARRLVKEQKLHFAGFFNGKVLIKSTEKSDTIRILQIEELNKYVK